MMTPRSSCPGGDPLLSRAQTSGSNYEINNVTDTALGNLARGTPSFCRSGRGLSYRLPGSFLEDRGGSLLALAEDLSHLRRKLDIDPMKPSYIVTETGVGYRLSTEI